MCYRFPIKYIMLSRRLVDYQAITYVKVGDFPINYIMLNTGTGPCRSTSYALFLIQMYNPLVLTEKKVY